MEKILLLILLINSDVGNGDVDCVDIQSMSVFIDWLLLHTRLIAMSVTVMLTVSIFNQWVFSSIDYCYIQHHRYRHNDNLIIKKKM